MKSSLLAAFLFLLAAVPCSTFSAEARQAEQPNTLRDIVLALDEKLFAAFNACDLDGFRLFIAEDIEFYQDNDDVTTSRKALEPSFMDRCDGDGRAAIQRELLPDTVEVHPIQGYGAVQFGAHQFWIMSDNQRQQLASTPRFVHLWRHKDGAWQITRVISYGH